MNISQFAMNHIVAALKISVEYAEAYGTKENAAQVNYALKLAINHQQEEIRMINATVAANFCQIPQDAFERE